jgi:PAT family beta-lactamase induction signal transducer AmpG
MIAKKKILLIWLVGLMSGFTIMISGNTLNFWLAKDQIDIETIGIFALISLPYAINFLWAPIFDVKNIPILSTILGHRTSWIVVIQIILSCSVYLLSTVEPAENLLLFASLALVVSFLSSAQDTVLGAFRVEMVDNTKQGQVSGVYVFGYRIGMLISSSGAIYISSYISWNLVYELFSWVILFFPVILLILGREEGGHHYEEGVGSRASIMTRGRQESSIFTTILRPIGDKKYIIMILVFLVLYRLPDNFIGMMINPFLIHIGYDEFEISTAGKFFGISAAIIGGLLAGLIMKYLNIFQSLLFFGVLHGVAHILFIIQEIYGKNLGLLFLVTGFESVTGGMTMAAYIGFIASQCKGRFKATQYSFLTSMMGLSRSILPALSGYIVTILGWKIFYLFASLATIPSLILIFYLRKSRFNS